MADKEASYGTSVTQFSRNFLKCMDIVNTITNIFLGAVAFALIFIAHVLRNLNIVGFRPYATHVILVAIGYVIMMCQAVLALNTTSGWAKAFQHHERKLIHLVMEVIGAIFAISGTVYAIANSNPQANKSAHGIIGIIAMTLTILGSLGGIVNYFWPDKAPPPTRMIHSAVGSLALVAAFTNLIIGLHKFRFIYDVNTASMYSVLAILALIGTLSSACINNIRRLTRSN